MMKFETGKYYSHPGGRQIAVVGEVKTTKWGKMFVLEEADKTGHGVSVMEIADIRKAEANGWIEIGKEEWMRNFEDAVCLYCEKCFLDGAKFVPTGKGPIHIECYTEYLKMTGPENIVTKESLN